MFGEQGDTLLLIIDNEAKAIRLSNALAPEGYSLETTYIQDDGSIAYTGIKPELAILWFPYSSPDALFELKTILEQIRSLDNQNDLPVLLIIDQEGTQFIEPGFKLGVAEILSRPIHPLVLRHRVKLLLQARRTEQAEERFRTVADFTYDWEYWKGIDGKIIYNSPACMRITGYEPQQIIEFPGFLLDLVHPADRERMQRHYEEEESSKEIYALDFRLLTRNNEVRWIGHVCQPVFSRNRQFLGRRVSNRDITDRKAAEENVVRTERLAAIGKLTASLAHEINNPLQAMYSSVELLTQFSLEPDEQKKYLEVTAKELERLMKITRGILNYSRPGLAEPELVFLKKVVEQAVFLASNQMHTSGIKFSLMFPEDLAPVMIVPDQIIQVCLNLVINALEQMQNGGELSVRAWQRGNRQFVSFTDTGPGISQSDQEKIFDPFFSTKEGGTGLGLAVSQKILFQHQGKIRVESKPGKGATFTIDIPVAPVEDEVQSEWAI